MTVWRFMASTRSTITSANSHSVDNLSIQWRKSPILTKWNIHKLTVCAQKMLGNMLFVFVLLISGSCQSIVYRSVQWWIISISDNDWLDNRDSVKMINVRKTFVLQKACIQLKISPKLGIERIQHKQSNFFFFLLHFLQNCQQTHDLLFCLLRVLD